MNQLTIKWLRFLFPNLRTYPTIRNAAGIKAFLFESRKKSFEGPGAKLIRR